MHYNINGIPGDLPSDKEFWIHYSNDNLILNKGDLLPDIDTLCTELHNLLADKLFGDMEKDYSLLNSVPIWIVNGGISPEVKISKENFESFSSKRLDNEKFNRLLYFFDFRNLISTLQNSVITTRYLLGQFYKLFNETDYLAQEKPVNSTGVQFTTGPLVINTYSTIYHLFIALYGLLDYTAKICYEFEHMPTEFKKYNILKSNKVSFKDKNQKINISNTKNTIFDESEIINMIITIRNEIVNHFSFTNIPKIYLSFNDDVLTEKYILLSDFKKGAFKTYKSRKYFYSDNNKLNEMLPYMVTGLWKSLKTTLKVIKVNAEDLVVNE